MHVTVTDQNREGIVAPSFQSSPLFFLCLPCAGRLSALLFSESRLRAAQPEILFHIRDNLRVGPGVGSGVTSESDAQFVWGILHAVTCA